MTKGDEMKRILILLLISGFPFYSAQARESVLEPGPYHAGHQTWVLEDTNRGVAPDKNSKGSDTRKLVTEIWYPSDDVSWTISGKNAPFTASPGPFPLIIYSHGIMSERREAAYLARYLATQGVVVVAFTAPATSLYNAVNLNYGDIVNLPGDVSFLIDEILKRNSDPSSPFYAKIDEACIGAAGTSLGAGVSLMAGFKSDLRDPRLSLVVTFAAGALTIFETRILPFPCCSFTAILTPLSPMMKMHPCCSVPPLVRHTCLLCLEGLTPGLPMCPPCSSGPIMWTMLDALPCQWRG